MKLADERFSRVDTELWIVRRLGDFGKHVFDGDTNFNIRKARIRQVIIDNHLANQQAGTREGRVITFYEVFWRFYGERLEGSINDDTGKSAVQNRHKDRDQSTEAR